jgi:hypothetical protein
MNRRLSLLISASALALLSSGPLALAAEETKPPMHMHKSQMDHRKDSEVAVEYKSEAAQLREKAEHHRKLAKLYESRSAPKGGANYANVAKHCEKLAKSYEEAAQAADAVSAELGKQPQ